MFSWELLATLLDRDKATQVVEWSVPSGSCLQAPLWQWAAEVVLLLSDLCSAARTAQSTVVFWSGAELSFPCEQPALYLGATAEMLQPECAWPGGAGARAGGAEAQWLVTALRSFWITWDVVGQLSELGWCNRKIQALPQEVAGRMTTRGMLCVWGISSDIWSSSRSWVTCLVSFCVWGWEEKSARVTLCWKLQTTWSGWGSRRSLLCATRGSTQVNEQVPMGTVTALAFLSQASKQGANSQEDLGTTC